jgi:hypothetical protein
LFFTTATSLLPGTPFFAATVTTAELSAGMLFAPTAKAAKTGLDCEPSVAVAATAGRR